MRKFRKGMTALKSGAQGAWRNRAMGSISSFCIAAVLFLFGLVLLAVLVANSVMAQMTSRVDEVELFLSDSLSETDTQLLHEETSVQPMVESVIYRSKAEAFQLMQASWGDDAYLLEGMEEAANLPASLVVTLSDISQTDDFINWANKNPNIIQINYFHDLVHAISRASRYLQIGGMAVVALLLLLSVFMISNTIKLTVMARQKEVAVMKCIGASDIIISGPFLIEGLIFGLIGAAIAFCAIFFGYRFLWINYGEMWTQFLAIRLIAPEVLGLDFAIIFAALGISIGVTGSGISLKKYLKV